MDLIQKILNNKKYLFFFVILSELYISLAYFIHPILAFLPFVIVTGLIVVYYFLLKGPVIWIMLMVFATGLDVWGQIVGGITIFHVGWVLSLLSTIIYLLLENKVRIKYIYPISKPFFVFILIAFVSLIYSPNFGSGLQIIVQTLALYVFFIIISNFVTSKNQVLTIILILLFVNVFQTFLLVHQLLFQNVTYFASYTLESKEGFRIYRPSGSFYDPNVLATYMIFGMLYTFSVIIFMKMKKFYKLILILLLSISSIGIVLTFSRSGWLSLIFGIFIILFVSKNKKLLLYIFTFIVVSLGLTYLYTPYGSLIIDRFSSISDIMQDPSIRVRIALIKSSIQMFLDHPFLGIGFRGFPKLYDFYLDPIVPQIQLYVKEPHTLWSSLLAELSIWGVLSVGYFFIKFIKDNFLLLKMNLDNYSKAIIVGTFSVFLAMNIDLLFYGFLFPHFNLLWLNFALFYSIKDNYVESKS